MLFNFAYYSLQISPIILFEADIPLLFPGPHSVQKDGNDFRSEFNIFNVSERVIECQMNV